MTIERYQPKEVFKTTKGELFETAEEAHTQEREDRLFQLVKDYLFSKRATQVSLVQAVDDMAVSIAYVVRETPLATTRLKKT